MTGRRMRHREETLLIDYHGVCHRRKHLCMTAVGSRIPLRVTRSIRGFPSRARSGFMCSQTWASRLMLTKIGEGSESFVDMEVRRERFLASQATYLAS